jgi:glycosyltransferase involved in cell wall biosynthesis
LTASPRVALGMPAYNRPDTLARALECLLLQTYRDFALVIVDDYPSSKVAAIVESYARQDPRITYEANPERLGMIGNWRLAFERCRAVAPESEFFAWVSDHDIWHPRWLEVLIGEFDANPDLVLACPGSLRMLDGGDVRMVERVFETVGIRTPLQRLRHASRHLMAGDMIYGLMRTSALARAGVFRPVIGPDRQVLLTLSLFGQMRQVPEILWYREVVRAYSRSRQRKVFFPRGAPVYLIVPSAVQHAAVLAWDLTVRGVGQPGIGRLAGIGYAAAQLWGAMLRTLLWGEWMFRWRRWRQNERERVERARTRR